MEIDFSPAEAAFLTAHLRRHTRDVENELARTDVRALQHELARDLELLQKLVQRLERASHA